MTSRCARIVACFITTLVGGWLASPASAAFTNQATAILGSNVNFESRSASLADIDNDGDLDLFFQGGGSDQKLFRNNLIGTGQMTFTNISSNVPSGLGPSWSAAWGDYDGDRKIDVFVGQSNVSSTATGDVLRNLGGTNFTNASVATGLVDPGFHQNVAWCDIDNDRDLDLLIGMEGPEKHEIYLQGPGGHFTPVGASVGFQADQGDKGYGMAIGDADGDGDMDVYISTCESDNNVRNNYYKNMLVETGSLNFIDVADANGTQFFLNSYGTEFHDFDNDGRLDLFMTGADQQPSKIFRNSGNGMFTDVDTITGHPLLTDTGGDMDGGKPIDYDNDGDLDLFFHDHGRAGVSNARKLYRNDGNWQFTDVTAAEGLAASSEGAYDSVWGDIDRDGDQDLIAPNATQVVSGVMLPERVFINTASTNGNRWLYLTLNGPTDNTTAIGATLYATINKGTPQEITLRRENNTNAGTFNQSDVPVHFGLGTATIIDDLRIEWPDGTVQFMHNVATNQYLDMRTPGDFNSDTNVNAADLLQLKGDFGVNGDSDANGDGVTDGADVIAWQRESYKAPIVTDVAPVPEPASAALALIALGLLVGRRPR